jgi:pimeloyl-ACP methyl ester carboxylesterase
LTIRSEVADALEAIKFLANHKHINSRRLALIGMSMGGTIAAHVVAREKSRVKSLVLWAPVAEGAGILDDLSTPDAVSSLAETGLTDHGGNLVGVAFVRAFGGFVASGCLSCSVGVVALWGALRLLAPASPPASPPPGAGRRISRCCRATNAWSRKSSCPAPITPSTNSS